MRSKDELTLRTIEDFEKAAERALESAKCCDDAGAAACARGAMEAVHRQNLYREIMISRAHTAAVGRMLARHLNGQQF